jgi:hypothetical protein
MTPNKGAQALAEGAALSDRWQRPGVLKEADAFVTRVHAEAVETFLESERIDKTDITIDFRGHIPNRRPDANAAAGVNRRRGRARNPTLMRMPLKGDVVARA